MVFQIFCDNLLASNQLVMNFNSLFTESDVEFWSRLQHNVVSSAYISISNLLLTVGRSLIYIRNSKGPMIDLCGTPVVIEALFDFMPSYSTY